MGTAPQRVLDTRLGGGLLGAGASRRVELAGAVPSGATSVVVNLTMTDTAGPGWAVVYDGDGSKPGSSTINADAADQTIANFAIVTVGNSRALSVYTTVASHFVVDVSGYFLAAETSAAGRYESLAPRRAVDTRTRGTTAAAGEFSVSLVGRFGLPERGVGAVAVVITATDTVEPGWVQISASGDATTRGRTSTLNVSRIGQSVANTAIVDLNDDELRVLTTAATHIIIDIVGWFTDASAVVSDDGLFVARPGTRLFDSRSERPVASRTSVSINALTAPNGWSAKAAIINLTAVDAAGAGYLTAFPHDPRPATSNLNLDHPNQTAPAGSLTALADGSLFRVFTSVATHLVVDSNGIFVHRKRTEDPTTTVPPTTHDPGATSSSTTPAPTTSTPTASTTSTSTTSTSTTSTSTTSTSTASTSTTLATTTTTTSTTTTTGPPSGERRCIVKLHGKGGGGSPTWVSGDGVHHITPNGNAPGWGGRQWLYYPESGYIAARSEVANGIGAAGCTRTIVYGFSNGAAFAAKLYCRGETFGGSVIGYLIDDPVVDQAVLGCAGNAAHRKRLYWTSDINIPDGWDCVAGDWTCEGGTAIGIARYEQALGLVRTPSVWTTHRPYDPPPEFWDWW